MQQEFPAAIRHAVRQLADETRAIHADLSAIPADAQTARGYEETVDYIAATLDGTAREVARVTVPDSHLRACWGADFEHARDYLSLREFAPRRLVAARLAGASEDIALHLTNNYDLYWGPRKERAGTVAQIMALKVLQASGVPLARSVFLSATPDAYIGGETGAGYVTAAGLGRADRVIAGSLGGPDLITVGYKGMVWAKIAIRGRPAHGSRPHEGRNAIEAMLWVQQRILEMGRDYATRPARIAITPPEASAPTITMCRIAGNLDGGFVAPDCALYVDRRVNPDERVADVEAELTQLVAEARRQTGFEVTLSISHRVEASYTDPDSTVYRRLAANLATLRGSRPEPVVWSHYLGLHYFTEAWGCEAVAYTPGRIGHGKVAVGPEDDDFDMDELLLAVEALALTACDLANRDV